MNNDVINATIIEMLLAIAVFLFSLYWFFRLKKSAENNPLNVFPEPPTHPIIGHVIEVTSTSNLIDNTKKLLQHGKTVKVRLGPTICPVREALVTHDYNFMEFIFNSNKILAKSETYIFLKDWLGKGLLLSDGEFWKRHRKILTPAFHFEILKEYLEVFESMGDIFVSKLRQCDGKSGTDIYPLITLYTLDVICESAMGTKLNLQNGKNYEYVLSVKEMCRIAVERTFSVIKMFWWSFWLTKDFYTYRKTLNILHNFTRNVIDTKRQEPLKTKKKKMAFLDLLLKFSQGDDALTDEEIREEVDTFMFEGHDTTSSAICSTLYCLAEHPDIQEKILQEQKDLFGDENYPSITYSDLQNMKYLEYVIKETLRLYPPVPVIGRYTTEDVKFGDYLIPKHTNIILFIYGLHRNAEYFPEPEKFYPERFETIDGSLPYAYVPFSAGSRNCIGQKFAMLELKSVISKVVRHFKIRHTSPKHELKLAAEAVLKSLNGVKVVIEKRN